MRGGVYILCSRPKVEQHLDWIFSIDKNASILQYQSILVLHPDLGINPYAYQVDKIEKQIADIINNWRKYEGILNCLKDDFSRDIFMRMIIFRMTYDPMIHKGIKTKYPHYFDGDIWSPSESEIFVDCGGYNGDTLREFQRITNNKFDGYFLFEPDIRLIEEAKQSADGDKRVSFINKGVWSEETELTFRAETSNGNGSMVMDNASIEISVVPVTSIDSVVNYATFIKMDVEGSEYEALVGASRLIRNSHPKMAICVYHKYEDYIVLFDKINELGRYDFYLRAQWDNIDTELYYLCIPSER